MHVAHVKGVGGAVVLAAVLILAATVPGWAQPPEDLVFDGNILFDNDGGAYGADTGGASCPGGAYSTTQLATVYFTRNRSVDPLVNPQVYTMTDPRWDLLAGSPALAAYGAPIVRASAFDPWFQDVCYTGAVPFTGGSDALDWTAGWTYHNQAGGSGRTDINFGKPSMMVTSDVISNTTWTSDKNWFLVGRIAVRNLATLTVQPGTVVLGSGVGSYLVIERGGKLIADGTRSDPIVFTSGSPLGFQAPGDWGGVVFQGRARANCSGSVSPGCGSTSATAECQSEGGAGAFGGNDDDDDQGVVRYCRVEYSGFEVAPNNELNCWTFNAVGRNTVIDYIQADHGSDDGIEFFGGTARARHLVATSNQDDNIDWQMGYRGYVQFGVVKQNPDFAADKAIEADNNEFAFNCELRSNPVLSNLTLVGTGALPGGAGGIHLRRGTACTILNSIVLGFSGLGLRIQNTETFDTCPGAQPALYVCPTSDAGPAGRGDDLQVSTGPNPAFGRTSISFALAMAAHVTVQLYDAAGRMVETLADRDFEPGEYSLPWDARQRAAGAYFYRVTAGERRAAGRLLVLR
jgi:hypothetical protein